jgi:hypothetical protein
MKTALLIGCGSKFGLNITKELQANGYRTYSISGSESTDADHLQIAWLTVTVADIERFLRQVPECDIVLFNQNASALSSQQFEQHLDTVELWRLEGHWSQAHFASCVLPFHIVHTLGDRLTSTSRVAWMLSNYVHTHPSDDNFGYADYIGNKQQNYLMMRNFSLHHPSCFVGINPDVMDGSGWAAKARSVVTVLESDLVSGTVYYCDGTIDTGVDVFDV